MEMVVTQQVQYPVHDQQLQLAFHRMTGCLRLSGSPGVGDENISQVMITGFRVNLIRGEG